MPIGDAFEVDAAFRAFKVIDVGDATLFASGGCETGDELGKLCTDTEVRGGFGIDAGQHIDQLGDKWSLVAVVEVKAPDAVAGGFFAKVVFLRKGLFVEVHEGGTDVEVGLQFVVDVGTRHSFGHHAEGVVFAADTDGRTGG